MDVGGRTGGEASMVGSMEGDVEEASEGGGSWSVVAEDGKSGSFDGTPMEGEA